MASGNPPLVRKQCENEIMYLFVQYNERSSASMESVAMVVCMFDDHVIMIP